ncbi:MAG: 50S ribosomal protein L24 [Alphaproteobacteria bacterium MarineAlpha5_Bin12]|nr:50S ribosomal protein L24 [Pelagibacteraceae bacterium]MBG76300.1 50S ribosomal protein L24 [Pelagibacteraceae bacterium]PPR42102.1 MAG: 50S ribosomal protein L24 [Alphaproteobacteria bacterium MarineAlpha5_Bin12]|tara:strand:- start:7790 stop:8101 length:312 start_codon:yes stop_codon:yes gene_type:complete
MKIKLKKGDEVIVLAGKNKGKTGKIVNVIPKKNKIIVSGVNIAKKHMKPNNDQAGGIVDKEMPIQISNVAYYDKETKKGVKIGYSFLKDGSKVRINKKNNKEL